MLLPRLIVSSVLVSAVAACASVSSNTSSDLTPQYGLPKASIYASYSGGIFDRTVHAWFRVERPAHLIVAHLGGEGVIRVLYPESPRDTSKVPARKSLRTVSFMAPHDVVPGMYSFVPTTIRNASARISSYDGVGHGYIFLIASEEPLAFDKISQGGLWDELEVPNYYRAHDPRIFAQDFADLVADGAPYTLRFAQSYTTSSFMSYASREMDCLTLSFMPLAALSSLGYYYGYRAYCPGSRYSLLDTYAYGARRRRYYPGWPLQPEPPTPVATQPPKKVDTTLTLAARPEGDTVVVPPSPQPPPEQPPGRPLENAAGPPGENAARPSGSRIATQRELIGSPRPRRQTLEPTEREERIQRGRPVLFGSPTRAERRADRPERPRIETIDRPRSTRVERSEPSRRSERVDRPAPPRRSEPVRAEPSRSEPRSQPSSPPARETPSRPPKPRPDQP